MTLLIALFIGAGFGALLQRVGVSRYEMVLETLRLRDLTLLKFMLLAIGVAAAGVGVLNGLGLAHLAIKPFYVLGVLGGGLIFGVGFALSGYCPGTCLVAGAEGRRDAWFAAAGGLAGALTYTLLHPLLKPLLIDRANLGQLTAASALHVSPALAGVVLGLAFVALSLALPARPGRGGERDERGGVAPEIRPPAAPADLG